MTTAIPNPASPASSTLSSISDEQQIRDLVATWMRAACVSDFDTLDQLIDPDILFHTVGREPFGREPFRDHTLRNAGKVRIEVQADVQEVQVSGDLAFARTKLDVHVTPDGRETMHRSGYTLGVYRRHPDGRWKLYRDANLCS